MKFTKLDAPAKVAELIKADGPEIIARKEQEKLSKVTTAETSKMVTALFVKCRDLINQQGAIYVDEENRAVALALKIHGHTKIEAKKCEDIAGQLKNKWDDKAAEEIADYVKTLRKLEADARQIKVDATAHQGFRGNLGDMTAALGADLSKLLRSKFLEYRDPPMKAYMALGDKWDKISEHRARGEHFLSMLPALKKQGEGNMEQLKADLERFVLWTKIDNKDGFGRVTSQVDKLEGYITTLKAHKTTPCTPIYMKTAKSGLASHDMTIKSLRSQLKTAKMLKDGFLKKAGPLAKDPLVQGMAKMIKTHFESMEADLKTYEKKFAEAMGEYAKVEKLLAK